jgi:hypothetical protein
LKFAGLEMQQFDVHFEGLDGLLSEAALFTAHFKGILCQIL